MLSVPSNVLLIVYKTLFLPYINYACCTWGLTTKHNLQRLQTLQNSAIRIIYGFRKREHVTPYRVENSLLSVKQTIHRFLCNFIHREIRFGSNESQFQPYFYFSSFSQDRNRLFLPYARLQIRQRTLFFRGIQFYNKLPIHIRQEESFANFKKHVKQFSFLLEDSAITI